MPTLESVAETHARRQKLIAQRTAQRVAKLWARVDKNRIVNSWLALVPEVADLFIIGQMNAAESSAGYVESALKVQGVTADAVGELNARKFAGIASDGRDLSGLLYQPAVSSLVAIRDGSTVQHAKSIGLINLDMITRTQIADAGRAAEATAIASRPRVSGYVRMLSRPSCSRCIILAGKWYRWNDGFRRHPRCDCRHVPSVEDTADDVRTDPLAAFHSLSPTEQDKTFTASGARAIREGADINQVVNARRGMDTAVVFGQTVQHTREGVTRFGVAGKKMGTKRPVRLMPEQIFLEARGNRDEAVRLLRLYSFIR